jgi:hypothetical protein
VARAGDAAAAAAAAVGLVGVDGDAKLAAAAGDAGDDAGESSFFLSTIRGRFGVFTGEPGATGASDGAADAFVAVSGSVWSETGA